MLVSDKQKQRFWSKVSIQGPDDCWPWTGATSGTRPYGRVKISGVVQSPHRVSWCIQNGTIPGGMQVLHKCDNPVCVNPRHLMIGTASENMQDMIAKGRSQPPRGVRHHRAKINENDVINIREEYFAGGVTILTLSEKFGISKAQAHRVIRGIDWGHVNCDPLRMVVK